jgi:hypothetical protein
MIILYTLGYIYLKECKMTYNKGTCTSKFIVALLTIFKLLGQLGDHQMMNGKGKSHMYTPCNIIHYI